MSGTLVHCRHFTPSEPWLIRKHHGCVAHKGQVIVFGGIARESDRLGQIVVLTPKAGTVARYPTQASEGCTVPSMRSGLGLTSAAIRKGLLIPPVSPENGKISHRETSATVVEGALMIGGWRGTKLKTTENDVWFLDIDALTWYKPRSTGDVPGPCNFPSLHTIAAQTAVLYRGGDGSGRHSELSLYNLQTGEWKRQKESAGGAAPCVRSGQASAVKDDSLLILGGWNGKYVLNDLWMWSLTSRMWLEIDISIGLPMGPRADASLSVVRDELVLFGGDNAGRHGIEKVPAILVAKLSDENLRMGRIIWNPPNCRSEAMSDVSSRVAHRCVTVGSDALVVVGGMEYGGGSSLLESSDSLRPSTRILYFLFDSQEGFAVPYAITAACPRGEQVFYLSKFACSPALADVTLDVQGFMMPVHRVILASTSRVFRRMFTTGLQESHPLSGQRPIVIKPENENTPPALFEIFLRFCYNLDLPNSVLEQCLAPWPGIFDRDSHASLLSNVINRVAQETNHSLRRVNDPPDYIRVTIPSDLLIGGPDCLPYSADLMIESTRFLLCLLQIADEFACSTLEATLPPMIAVIMLPEIIPEVQQCAIAFGSRSLENFIEWRQRHPQDSRQLWKTNSVLPRPSSSEDRQYVKRFSRYSEIGQHSPRVGPLLTEMLSQSRKDNDEIWEPPPRASQSCSARPVTSPSVRMRDRIDRFRRRVVRSEGNISDKTPITSSSRSHIWHRRRRKMT